MTAGPQPLRRHGPAWFKLFSAVAIVLALGLAAALTAGLVNRLLTPA